MHSDPTYPHYYTLFVSQDTYNQVEQHLKLKIL